MMSCSTTPPQPCTASLTSVRAPSEVITIGTLYFAHICMSCSSRSLLLCTIWLTANGAAGLCGCALLYAASVSVISASHSSSCSAGRALSAAFDDRVANRRHLAEDVVGIEARGRHFGLQKGGVAVAVGELLFGDQQCTRHLPAGHHIAAEHQVRHRAGEHRVGARLGVAGDK